MSDTAEDRRKKLWLIWRTSLIGLATVYVVLIGAKLMLVLPAGYSWTAMAIASAVMVLALPLFAIVGTRVNHWAWSWGTALAYACLLQLCVYILSH